MTTRILIIISFVLLLVIVGLLLLVFKPSLNNIRKEVNDILYDTNTLKTKFKSKNIDEISSKDLADNGEEISKLNTEIKRLENIINDLEQKISELVSLCTQNDEPLIKNKVEKAGELNGEKIVVEVSVPKDLQSSPEIQVVSRQISDDVNSTDIPVEENIIVDAGAVPVSEQQQKMNSSEVVCNIDVRPVEYFNYPSGSSNEIKKTFQEKEGHYFKMYINSDDSADFEFCGDNINVPLANEDAFFAKTAELKITSTPPTKYETEEMGLMEKQDSKWVIVKKTKIIFS